MNCLWHESAYKRREIRQTMLQVRFCTEKCLSKTDILKLCVYFPWQISVVNKLNLQVKILFQLQPTYLNLTGKSTWVFPCHTSSVINCLMGPNQALMTPSGTSNPVCTNSPVGIFQSKYESAFYGNTIAFERSDSIHRCRDITLKCGSLTLDLIYL